MTKFAAEFVEIAHSGGQYTVNVRTTPEGKKQYALGMRHSRPVPMSAHAIYALPQGIPVSMLAIGGIGAPMDRPPVPGCYSIFIASDSHGMFGHVCPTCKGYWRSSRRPAKWSTTCAYCGQRGDGHHFLSDGQRAFVRGCCDLIEQALGQEKDGEYVVDMDLVADAVGKEGDKPPFYSTDVKQQNLFECSACGCKNDILGKYGYCSSCGTSNGMQMVEADVNALRKSMAGDVNYALIVKETISAFDGFARHLTKQMVDRIPMTPGRKKEWGKMLFHNLRRFSDPMKADFDVDFIRGLKPDDVEFMARMFFRRHVYEHNGGEVDQKYLDDSGDTTVRLKQVIRESAESASRTCDLALKMSRNLHAGFHDIFPAEEMPLRLHQDELARRR